MLEFPGEGVNLRKSAVFCKNLRFGRSLSPQFRHLKRSLIESLHSLNSLEDGRILLCFPESGGSLKSLESLHSLESLGNGRFWKTPFPKAPFFRTRIWWGKQVLGVICSVFPINIGPDSSTKWILISEVSPPLPIPPFRQAEAGFVMRLPLWAFNVGKLQPQPLPLKSSLRWQFPNRSGLPKLQGAQTETCLQWPQRGFPILETTFPYFRQTVYTRSKNTPVSPPNHVRTTSEPHPNCIRTTFETMAEVKGKMVSSSLQPHENPYLTTFADIRGGMVTQRKSFDATSQTPPRMATLRNQECSRQRPQTTKPCLWSHCRFYLKNDRRTRRSLRLFLQSLGCRATKTMRSMNLTGVWPNLRCAEPWDTNPDGHLWTRELAELWGKL